MELCKLLRQPFPSEQKKLVLVNLKSFIKSLNTTSCINQLLLTSKERVASGTNFNGNILNC